MLLSNPINVLESTGATGNEVDFGLNDIDIQWSFLSVPISNKKTMRNSGSSKFFSAVK